MRKLNLAVWLPVGMETYIKTLTTEWCFQSMQWSYGWRFLGQCVGGPSAAWIGHPRPLQIQTEHVSASRTPWWAYYSRVDALDPSRPRPHYFHMALPREDFGHLPLGLYCITSDQLPKFYATQRLEELRQKIKLSGVPLFGALFASLFFFGVHAAAIYFCGCEFGLRRFSIALAAPSRGSSKRASHMPPSDSRHNFAGFLLAFVTLIVTSTRNESWLVPLDLGRLQRLSSVWN